MNFDPYSIYSFLILRKSNEIDFCKTLSYVYKEFSMFLNSPYCRNGNAYYPNVIVMLERIARFLYINSQFIKGLSKEDLLKVMDLLTLAKSQNIKVASWLNCGVIYNLYENYTNSR